MIYLFAYYFLKSLPITIIGIEHPVCFSSVRYIFDPRDRKWAIHAGLDLHGMGHTTANSIRLKIDHIHILSDFTIQDPVMARLQLIRLINKAETIWLGD